MNYIALGGGWGYQDKSFYYIASDEMNVYPKRMKMIFSQVKEYNIFTTEKQQVHVIFTTSFGLLRLSSLFPEQMPIPLRFLDHSNFSVSEQNYQELVCIFLVTM